jgi:hypothetical protein
MTGFMVKNLANSLENGGQPQEKHIQKPIS